MDETVFISFLLYVIALVFIGYFGYKKSQTVSDFYLGSRRSSSLITAISAHASDMSAWLFLGLPVAVFTRGAREVWSAFGLILGMWVCWTYVASLVRVLSEKTKSYSIPSFIAKITKDPSPKLQRLTAFVIIFFFVFYIASGFKGMAGVLGYLFGIPQSLGVFLSASVIGFYTILGGYVAVSYAGVFQGIFLLIVICFVPLFMWMNLNSRIDVLNIFSSITSKDIDFSFSTIGFGLLKACNWGLGYLGMPHILTKFMGIRDISEIKQSRAIGLGWQILALSASISIGLLAHFYIDCKNGCGDYLFVALVQDLLTPFFAGIVFCALIAATVSTVDSQIIVSATSLSSDFKKKNDVVSLQESRWAVFKIILAASVVANIYRGSLYDMVLFSWSGLGSSLGPVVLCSLYFKKVQPIGAWFAVFLGALISVGSCLFSSFFSEIPLLPGFLLGCVILTTSSWVKSCKN